MPTRTTPIRLKNGQTRTIHIRTLEDGRDCIHWFRIDDAGPIKIKGGVVQSNQGGIQFPSKNGWVACNLRQNSILPQERGLDTFICQVSDDPRGATCPDCQKTAEFVAEMAKYPGEKIA